MAFTPGKYYVNTVVRLTVNFEEDDGDDVDPTTVTFKTMSPSWVETSYVYGTDDEVQKASVGNYTADVTPDEAGRWRFRWETTGTGTTIAVEGDFLVQYSAFYDDVFSDYAL